MSNRTPTPPRKNPEDLPIRLLGRNDYPIRTTPKLGISNIDGLPVVVPEDRGKYGTRTGRTERQ